MAEVKVALNVLFVNNSLMRLDRGRDNVQHIRQSRLDEGFDLNHFRYENLLAYWSCSLLAQRLIDV